MKLASLKSGRDGALVVVSKDMTRCVRAGDIAATLQAALDEWEMRYDPLQELSDRLNRGAIEGEAFDPRDCAAPLPRAFQWADGSAYVNHVELVRRARGAELPESFWSDPLMYQGCSDWLLGPTDPIECYDPEAYGLDFEAEVAVITTDTPMMTDVHAARDSIALVTLVNDVSLRGLIPAELAKGFGFFQSKPASAFAPIAATPDELGIAWDGGKLHLPLHSRVNGLPFGRPNAGVDMTFDFPTLIAHAAKTRNLCAGSIVGSGTVSNRDADGGPGRPVADGGAGYSCIAELRMIETISNGAPTTPWLGFGDRVQIEMLDAQGRSVFGAIDQTVVAYDPPGAR